MNRKGLFPAMSAMTYPSQVAEAVPFTPLLQVESSRLPAELTGEAIPVTELAVATPAANKSADWAAAAEQSVGTTVMKATALSLKVADVVDEPETISDENIEIMSLAGGSFAEALTPPPMPAKPPALVVEDPALEPQPTLTSMSALGPPPWEQVSPPPLAKPGGNDDQWAISNGPPPLAMSQSLRSNNGAPPPIRSKSAEDFAQALGLPTIEIEEPEVEPEKPEAKPVIPDVLPEPEIDETAIKPRSAKVIWLTVLALLIAAAGAAVAVVNPAGLVSQFMPGQKKRPILVESLQTPDPPPPASPAHEEKPEKKSEEPKKANGNREAASEHYAKGNKLYLQHKYGDAIAEFKKALEADSSFALAHRALGVTYASQSKPGDACREYRAYIQVQPNAKDAQQVKSLLKNCD